MAEALIPGEMTPYSTVRPLVVEDPIWIPESERERIASYAVYDAIYWSVPKAFKLTMRGTNDQPVYIPNARTIVNETAHYLLKGLQIGTPDGEKDSELGKALGAFLKRERFYSKFHTAKWSGVNRGDWILHITADPDKPEGTRISVNSVDPAAYFPIYDEDDLDRIIGVDLVEPFVDTATGKNRVKRLRYTYIDGGPGNPRQVMREQVILEQDGWWKGKAVEKKVVTELKPELLPEGITTIPVYHFKNIDWQGQPFGSSELRGFEYLMGSVNQTVSDEELALALIGLGVYATDAPTPTNDAGEEEDWEIAPAKVLEVPTGSRFERVEGIRTLNPMLEHVKLLTDSLFEGSSTFRSAQVDVQLAASGVALAMKFLPTMAKLEQRDWDGTATLENMFFDWKFWHKAYEGQDFTDKELAVTLGDKLPLDRTGRINELNNMIDRMIIDRQYYRSEMEKMGYRFPVDMAERVRKEQEQLTKARMFESPVNGVGPDGKPLPTADGSGRNGSKAAPNQSNNSGKPNESGGTEAKPPARQAQ